MKKSLFLAAVLTTGLSACSSKSVSPDQAATTNKFNLPEWVVKPTVDNGLTATGCVRAVGDIGADMERADLQATAQLAAMTRQQLQSLRENYSRVSNTGSNALTPTGQYESVVRSVVDQRMVGVHRVQWDYIDHPSGNTQSCSQMAVGNEAVNAILEKSSQAAGYEAAAFTQDEYREQFMSQKAFQRLNEQLIQKTFNAANPN